MIFLLIPWCFIFSFVSTTNSCTETISTDDKECEHTIEWKVRNNKTATATCREFFPTASVVGIIHPTDPMRIVCTVSRQFQCNFLTDAIPIFDKCYTFSKSEVSLDFYLNNNPKKYCDSDGGIPVFFTMTQAKHIAKEARRKGISKMWININKIGKTIEHSNVLQGLNNTGFLLYKHKWKVHEGTYWDGEELKKSKINHTDGKIQYDNPKNVTFLFFRTKTDYVHNLIQGFFERANKDAKASVVCEYNAKKIPSPEKYCEKIKKLGINALYDNTSNRRRCVYTTFKKYMLEGTKTAIENFPGCTEKSADHSSGLDDGTAKKEIYEQLTEAGTYRLAAIKTDKNKKFTEQHTNWGEIVRQHCDPSSTTSDLLLKQREPYEIFDHFFNSHLSAFMTSPWNEEYPKNECTDFPSPKMDSNGLAISKGQIIDVPVPFRLPAICSIESGVCSRHKKLCERKDHICKDVKYWNKETKNFAECVCPQFHNDKNGQCHWENERDSVTEIVPADSCGMAHSFVDKNWRHVRIGWYDTVGYNDEIVALHPSELPPPSTFRMYGGQRSETDKVVVRNGCKMTIWTQSERFRKNNTYMLKDLSSGEHIVPNHLAGTLAGWPYGMSAASIECSCPDDHPLD